MIAREFAPAKVNLFLHVGPLDARDGYHPVSSLMVFADVGDELVFAPGEGLELVVDGPFAEALTSVEAADNLVVRSVRALLAHVDRSGEGVALRLTKRLPVAAGLGGGSSDAGAALRLVRRALALPVDDVALAAIAAELGADGPACLAARTVLGLGRGDVLAPAPGLPTLHAVLVNPRRPCPTGAVYRGYDAAPVQGGEAAPDLPAAFADAAAVIAFLHGCRNDLQAPAAALVPAVAETLARVGAQPLARLVRLSGSGATVFALCDDAGQAETLRQALSADRPDWWIRRCRLGAPSSDAARQEPSAFIAA